MWHRPFSLTSSLTGTLSNLHESWQHDLGQVHINQSHRLLECSGVIMAASARTNTSLTYSKVLFHFYSTISSVM